MLARSSIRRWAPAAALLLVAIAPAASDEVKGKWRLELHVGGYDPGDSIESETDFTQVVRDPDGRGFALQDPRRLNVEEATLDASAFAEFRAGYGLHAWKNGEIILDAGVGFFASKIDNLEFSYLLDKAQSPFVETMLLEVGEMETVPVSVGLYARYSPTKRFNPYFGVNLGYMFHEFSESDEWRTLADQLDASLVSYIERDPDGGLGTRVLSSDPQDVERFVASATVADRTRDLYTVRTNRDLDSDGTEDCIGAGFSRIVRDAFGNERIEPVPCLSITGHDLARPRVDTPDTFYLEIRGGADWQWRPKIAVFGELRFSWAARDIEITADGRQKFGKGVGDGDFTEETAPSPRGGRAAYINLGGLVETAGGVTGPQPGQYWINGGILDYGGFTFTAGLRFSL